MNTTLHRSLSAHLCIATMAASLLFVPIASRAQDNTATGVYALHSNTSGFFDTADGYEALYHNTTGSFNTAIGLCALFYNTSGEYNTGIGANALANNISGHGNTASGVEALFQNTSGSNNIAIGNIGFNTDSGAIRIGTKGTQTATYIAGISGVNAAGGVAVYINANGQLGTITSSRRFKNDIHTMGSASDKLMQLRPVTFRYKKAAEDGTHPLQYGLIAEEVAKVYPDLVQYDRQGKPFTVYYHLLTPMLLSALQKEHHHNVAQQNAIAAQNAKIVALNTARRVEATAQNRRIAGLEALVQQQNAELASFKQAQEQQRTVLAKLSAFVQATGKTEALQKAVFIQR